ncbi:MAG: hypothetical protein IKC46_04440 [Lachnospiraceae bacterium]|nr:hypothetical protein [Lachnospiraceae bacterium]
MANHLAIDSGGTKVLGILYDDDFTPKAISRVGSFRTNTTSPELVRHNMEQMQKELGLVPGTVIDSVNGIVYQEFVDFLQKTCEIRQINSFGELEAGLHAACIFGDGMMTLSGTGSNVGAFYQGQFYVEGGYGASVSDAGSGYWMARDAMNAAIADNSGYGDPTMLTGLIAAHFGFPKERFHDAVFSIYNNTDFSPVAQVASCAPLVSQAASAGDRIACEILKQTGLILGKQAVALIRKKQLPDSLPMTISGSVWRSHRILFDAFADCIHAQSPKRPICIPEFEPIVGIMIRHYHMLHGDFDENARQLFKTLYPQYRFEMQI